MPKMFFVGDIVRISRIPSPEDIQKYYHSRLNCIYSADRKRIDMTLTFGYTKLSSVNLKVTNVRKYCDDLYYVLTYKTNDYKERSDNQFLIPGEFLNEPNNNFNIKTFDPVDFSTFDITTTVSSTPAEKLTNKDISEILTVISKKNRSDMIDPTNFVHPSHWKAIKFEGRDCPTEIGDYRYYSKSNGVLCFFNRNHGYVNPFGISAFQYILTDTGLRFYKNGEVIKDPEYSRPIDEKVERLGLEPVIIWDKVVFRDNNELRSYTVCNLRSNVDTVGPDGDISYLFQLEEPEDDITELKFMIDPREVVLSEYFDHIVLLGDKESHPVKIKNFEPQVDKIKEQERAAILTDYQTKLYQALDIDKTLIQQIKDSPIETRPYNRELAGAKEYFNRINKSPSDLFGGSDIIKPTKIVKAISQ